jgi:hypothetical protein
LTQQEDPNRRELQISSFRFAHDKISLPYCIRLNYSKNRAVEEGRESSAAETVSSRLEAKEGDLKSMLMKKCNNGASDIDYEETDCSSQ